MSQHQKKVAAIHDLPGSGKYPPTAAFPVLFATILSTHTGGIPGLLNNFNPRGINGNCHFFPIFVTDKDR